MAQLSTERFQQADKYMAYLRTTKGRLRSDLAWSNVRRFLPGATAGLRAADVGGGTGIVSLRLAELGFETELLDDCEAMLALAKKDAEGRALRGRISFRQCDAAYLSDMFQPSSFQVVICHNLLEYMENPSAVLKGVTRVLDKDERSVVSLLVRNRFGEVLKAAINDKDEELVRRGLVAQTVLDSLYGAPVRLFDPADIRAMLQGAGLKVIAEYGVRIVSDYVDSDAMTDESYGRLLDLELLLGAQPQFAGIARYTQFIARANATSS